MTTRQKELTVHDGPAFDLEKAHRFFSADCFNRAWDLMDSPSRSREEELKMLAVSQASIFHWLSRPDVTDKNLSVGYWQASRVLALLGQPAAAGWLADVSLGYAQALGPFLRGYSHEALARAALGAGDLNRAREFIVQARALAAETTDAGDRALLEKDLSDLSEAADAAMECRANDR
jgi:hypothetical protein